MRLQYLRAAAALAVLLYHASVVVERVNGTDSYISVFGGFWGAYGVAVFFALSGYLMGELIQRDDPARFLVSRIARIYPPMLLAVAVFWIAFLAAGFPRSIDVLGLSLVPAGGRDYFLAVEWTLVYEMSYYVVLAVLAFAGLRRLTSWFAIAWMAVIFVSVITTGVVCNHTVPLASELPVQAINLPFLIGLLLSEVARRRWLPPGLLLVAIPATIAAAYILPGDPRLNSILPAALLVAAAIRAPKSAPVTAMGRFGERLGDASYMLYLCHMPLMTVLSGFVPARSPSLTLWLGGVSASVAISLLLAQADLSMHRWLKGRIAVAPARRIRVIAVSFVAAFIGVAAYAEVHTRAQRTAYSHAMGILTNAEPSTSPSILAEVDAIQRLPDGTLVVRGYAIDLNKPNLASHAAVMQRGRIISMERSRRMRPGQAKTWSRPDLANVRFGFVLMVPKGGECSSGKLDVRVALEDGRMIVPAILPQAALCD